MSTLDHIGVSVSDFGKAKAFYVRALAPLGIAIVMEVPKSFTGTADFVGFGKDRKPDFWITDAGSTSPHLHLAFVASNRAEVDAFYATAIAAGGMDNGPPGLRPHYHPNYYAAFVFDPDGHNIEAVCHSPV